MNFSRSLKSINKAFSQNGTAVTEMVPGGNLEIVNFPSTGELFDAVIGNSCHASKIGNVNGKTLKPNESACGIFAI